MNAYQPQQVIHQNVIQPPSNGLAVTSLVLGIVAVVIGVWSFVPFLGVVSAFISFLPAILAVVFGHIGLKTSSRVHVGRGPALTGLILGYVTLAIIALTTLFWILAIAASAASSSSTI